MELCLMKKIVLIHRFQENKTTQGEVSFLSLLSESSFSLHAKSQQIVKGVTGT